MHLIQQKVAQGHHRGGFSAVVRPNKDRLLRRQIDPNGLQLSKVFDFYEPDVHVRLPNQFIKDCVDTNGVKSLGYQCILSVPFLTP